MKNKIPFDPNAFDSYLTVKELSVKFDYLKDINFKEMSLNEELTNINYEITSPEYKDKAYANISDYFDLEVDMIV